MTQSVPTGFQVFKRGHGSSSLQMRVDKKGSAYFNKAVVEALGEPETVVFLVSEDGNSFAIMDGAGFDDSYKVSKSRTVAARSLSERFEWPAGSVITLTEVDGYLVGQTKASTEEATK